MGFVPPHTESKFFSGKPNYFVDGALADEAVAEGSVNNCSEAAVDVFCNLWILQYNCGCFNTTADFLPRELTIS